MIKIAIKKRNSKYKKTNHTIHYILVYATPRDPVGKPGKNALLLLILVLGKVYRSWQVRAKVTL